MKNSRTQQTACGNAKNKVILNIDMIKNCYSRASRWCDFQFVLNGSHSFELSPSNGQSPLKKGFEEIE